MSLQDRLTALKTKHAQLEEALADEFRRPLPDSYAINDLKRRKLRIKDELEKMTTH